MIPWLIGGAVLFWISKRSSSSAAASAAAPVHVVQPAVEDPFFAADAPGDQEDFKLTDTVAIPTRVPFNTNYRLAQPFRPPKITPDDNFVSPIGTHVFTSNYRLGLGGLGTGGVRF
jgi:hypothetical protein